MSNPTRLPNGLSTEKAGALANFGFPNPAKWHTYFDDFDTYTAADWTVTEVGIATQALNNVDGGQLLITNAAALNDSSFSQLVGESFQFEAGKKLVFEARFTVNDAIQTAFVMGLQITDSAPLDVSDGVFFQKDDNDALLDFHVEKDNTSTDATGIHTMVNATFVKVGFAYDGKSEIKYYVDDAHLGTLATTNMPDDEVLTISYGVDNGEAAIKSMTIDYILAAKER